MARTRRIRFPLPQLVWGAFLLFSGILSPALGGEALPVLGSLRATAGAHPVQGMEDGLLFVQRFEPDCRTVVETTDPESVALAGSRGSKIELEVAALTCVGAEPPPVTCDWKIAKKDLGDPSCSAFEADPLSGTGSSPTLSLELPEKTGVYELSMTCTPVGGRPVKVERRLFVTYSKPLTVVDPPRIVWYERAACWAGGVGKVNVGKVNVKAALTGKAAGEKGVLDALRGGLYRYGQENWRYGYTSETEDGDFVFELADGELEDYDVERDMVKCLVPGDEGEGDQYCKCFWQELVDPESGCNFSDCYVFSDVFQAMAAVMGVGGLGSESISGQLNAGFSSTRRYKSLDPSFSGNVLCEDDGDRTPCAYHFGAHSLRLRDGTYYDSTFGESYRMKTKLIELSKVRDTGSRTEFVPEYVMCNVEPGYGSWPYLFDPMGQESECTDEDTDLSPANAPIRVRSVTFSLANYDASSLFDSLKAEIELEIDDDAEYFLLGGLMKDGRPIVSRPSRDTAVSSFRVVSREKNKTALYFSGEEISRSNVKGPYTLYLTMCSYKNLNCFHDRSFETDAYDPKEFGELEIEIDGMKLKPFDLDRNKLYDGLRATITLGVRLEGTYTVEMRVAKLGRTIGYAGEKVEMGEADREEVELEIPGEEIARWGLDGPYDVTVVIYNGRLRNIYSTTEKASGKKFFARKFE